ncbi:matrixin family metalloprotease [Arthrobacter sp. TMS2-4]
MGAMDREWFHEGRDARMKAVQRSPSGRIPGWALDDALGTPSAPPPWRAAPTYGPASKQASRSGRARARERAPARRRRMRRLGTVAGVGLVAALYAMPSLFDRFVLPVALPYLPGADVPPRGVGAGDAPLGTPPPAPASTAFALLDSPVEEQEWIAYDPCRPVHYVVRPDNAPAGSEGLVQEAVAAVSVATGLQFIDDGVTTEAPSEDRDLYQPELYGKTWVPVLITWTSEAEIPGLAGDIAGLGGSDYAQAPGQPLVYAGGQVQLDAPDAARSLSYPDGRAQLRAIIMHELAHVVGLDHVDDPGELMYEQNMGRVSFGEGDRAGLALLGSGPCAPGL